MSPVTKETIIECRKKLQEIKADLLNQMFHFKNDLIVQDKSTGDEIDQSVAHLEEHHLVIKQGRIREKLLEVEMALARIEQGTYGICEETQEPIEEQRLLALPYTRLSIEGAEMREAMSRRFMKFS